MLIFSLDTKKCMNALLLHPAFDSFLFIEGDITTFNTFQFNGRLKKDFFSAEEKEALDDREYALWKELREFCLSLIKGKRTPLGISFCSFYVSTEYCTASRTGTSFHLLRQMCRDCT